MILLHLADLHIGKRVNGFSMLEDQQYILKQVLELIDAHHTEGVLIAGDIYDKPVPSAEAVKVFDAFLTELCHRKQKIFIISGNHDSAERIAFGGKVMEQAAVYVSPVFDGKIEPITLEDAYGKVDFYLLPYLRPAVVKAALRETGIFNEGAEVEKSAKTAEIADRGENGESEAEAAEAQLQTYQQALAYVLGQITLDPTRRNVILAHQFLTGAAPSESEEFSIGGMENVSADLFAEYDYVALGHIHRSQQVSMERIRYAGTLLKYSFSEAGHKKVVPLVTLGEKGVLDIQELPLFPLRDLREIKGSYMEITDRNRYSQENTEDYVHITLTDEEDILDVVNRLRVIYPNLMRLDYDNTRTRENRQIVTGKSTATKSPMELFEEFYEQQNNQPMSEAQRNFAEDLLEKIGGYSVAGGLAEGKADRTSSVAGGLAEGKADRTSSVASGLAEGKADRTSSMAGGLAEGKADRTSSVAGRFADEKTDEAKGGSKA